MSNKNKKNKNFFLLIITIILFLLSIYFIYLWLYSAINRQEIPFTPLTTGLSCLGACIFLAFLCCCPLCMKEFYPEEYKRIMANPLKQELENLEIDERDIKRIGNNKIHLDKNDIKTENALMKIAQEDKTVTAKITELFLILFFLFIACSIIPIYDIITQKTISDMANIYIILGAIFVVVFLMIRLPQILKDKNKSEFTKENLIELFGYFYKDKISITIPSFHRAEVIEWTTEKKASGSYSKVQRLFKFTIIGESVFDNWTNLKSIKLPDTLKQIKKNAFNGCTSLENLVIPNNVDVIGENAFLDVPHIEYYGSATGAPWGAKSMN